MDSLRTWTLLLACLTLHAAVLQAAVVKGSSEDLKNSEKLENLEDLGSEEKDSWEQEKGSEELSTADIVDQEQIDNEVLAEESEESVSKVSLASRAATTMREGFQSMLDLVDEHDSRIEELQEYVDELQYKVDSLREFVGDVDPEPAEGDCLTADKSGTYTINKYGLKLKAYCQVDNTGKWTVIQRREDGSIDFYRNWANYSKGFGDLAGEHWLGNDNIHDLTAAGLTRLRIDLEDWENNKHTVYYDEFLVAGAGEKYKLTVSGFTGSKPPGDALAISNGMEFTTYDKDNDQKSSRNCAVKSKGAWWYKACHRANLNGQYKNKWYAKGVNWYYWKGYRYSLKKTTMMISKPCPRPCPIVSQK